MDIRDFKKIKRRIDKIIQNFEDKAVGEGFDIAAQDFQELMEGVKSKILSEKGISLEDYEELEQRLEEQKEEGKKSNAEKIDYLAERLRSVNEKDLAEMKEVAEKISQQTISQIREGITWENIKNKPKLFTEQDAKKAVEIYGLKEKDIKQLAELRDLKDNLHQLRSQFLEKMKAALSKISDIKQRQPEKPDLSEYLKKQDIDLGLLKKEISQERPRITVGAKPPENPKEGDLWVDTS